MTPSPKLSWFERARQVYDYHKEKLRETNGKWRVKDTAKFLNRSEGSVAEDLMVIDWHKTYPKIEHLKNLTRAKEYVRLKKKELRLS